MKHLDQKVIFIKHFMTKLTSLKPCEHKTDEPCSYNKLRKEDPKDIAKRLGKFVDERAANATETDMNDAEEFWVDIEGLVFDTHPHFKTRIARIARDMRIEPEIEMIPIVIQRYIKWIEETYLPLFNRMLGDNYKSDNNKVEGRNLYLLDSEGVLRNCIAEIGINLHNKTIRLILEEIKTMIDTGIAPTIKDTKKLDRELKKFVRKNPRQRKLSVSEKRYMETVGEFYSYLDTIGDR